MPAKLYPKYKVQKGLLPIPVENRDKIKKFFNDLDTATVERYIEDWTDLSPKGANDISNRWKFSYCTMNTAWERSCEQFETIRHTNGIIPKAMLMEKLAQSSGGMWESKSNGIHHFSLLWWKNRDIFTPTDNWQDWRNSLIDTLVNIGQAKISFAIEMTHPLTAQCLCLDRHMLRAFGWDDHGKSPTLSQYIHYEDYWLNQSDKHNIPPVISRNIYWDRIQQQQNSYYWAHVIK